MNHIFLILIFLAIGFIVGFVIGARRPKNDGFIYLEKNDQGDDRIRFYLNMEYDDIASHDRIIFDVVKGEAV